MSLKSTLSMVKIKRASLWEVLWLQNTLLKEKVTQETDGLSSRRVLQESVQSSVRLSLKPLFMQADERVVFSGSSLIARLAPGSWFQKTSIANGH